MVAEQEPITIHPPLPSGVTRETADRVLSLYLTAPETPLTHIAADLGLSINLLGQIIDSDYVRPLLDLVARLNTRRLEVLAGELRTKALYSTARLAESAASEETRRLAAGSLLRLVPFTSRHRPPTDPPAPPDGSNRRSQSSPSRRAEAEGRVRATQDHASNTTRESVPATSPPPSPPSGRGAWTSPSLQEGAGGWARSASDPASRVSGSSQNQPRENLDSVPAVGTPVAAQPPPKSTTTPRPAPRPDAPPNSAPPLSLPVTGLLDRLAASMTAPRSRSSRARDAPRAA